MRGPGKRNPILVCSLLTVFVVGLPCLAAAAGMLAPDTRLAAVKANHGAITQIADLTSSGNKAEANLIRAMIEMPQAVWLTGGTPKQVLQNVRNTVDRAADKGTVPVLVAYNLPFRDCSQYSAGGALDAQAYREWIDGFAAGIGARKAVVILEPDGLGIIPWYRQFRGLGKDWKGDDYDKLPYEWCQPAEAAELTAADERFAMLNYAVDALKAHANVAVYLDGTHSDWLGAGDAAHRLVQAGVQRADGFFVNVSNYQATEHLEKYGTWIAKCIWFGTEGSWGINHFDYCASQYYPATSSDFSTWGLSDQWYVGNVEAQTWVPYPGDAGLKRFVIDTSRNGQGKWTPTASYPDKQDWCNPPDRGLGARPSTNTGVPLLDAFLWIKIPGESDGQCNRGTGGTTDPARGDLADPAAGQWFPEMALELVRNANPPLP